MTVDELFPRDQFPLRARIRIPVTEGAVVATLMVFYQRPTCSFRDQEHGEWISCHDGDNKTFDLAVYRLSGDQNDDRGFYMGKSGDIEAVSCDEVKGFRDECEAGQHPNIAAAGKKLKEVFGGNTTGIEWEQF